MAVALPKNCLLAIDTGTLTPLTDAQIAKYDYVITQWDRASRIAGVKAINPNIKFLVYQNSLLANADGSSGVSKAQMDANPTWFAHTLSTETYRNSVLRDSPVHFWEMQETTGTVATDTGSSPSNGTYTANQTLNQASLTGNAGLKSVSFPDTGGFGTPVALAASQNYTFEGWARRTASTNRDTLLGSTGASHQLLLACRSGTNDIDFWLDAGGASKTWFNAAPAPGTSFHWAVVYDASTLTAELFINGSSKGTVTFSAGINGGTVGNLVIGAWQSGLTTDSFNGRLSHIAMWTSKLTASRISAHYTNGPTTVAGGNAIIMSQLFANNWLADQSSAGYRTQWNSNVISLLGSAGWDGVFVDDIDTTPYGHSASTIGDPANPFNALTATQFATTTRAFLVQMYAAIHAAGYLVIGNITNSANYATFTDWISLLDGSSREFWKKFGTGDSSGTPPQQPWTGNSRFISTDYDFDQSFFYGSVNLVGKTVIPITYGVLTDTIAQKYGWVSFLLDCKVGNNSAYCFCIRGSTVDPWTTSWTTKIGNPTADKVSIGDHIWVRQFENGIVVLNANDSSRTIDTTPYGALQRLDGSIAGSSMVLAAGSAEILTFVVSAPPPPETGLTDAELNYIDESPPGFFPENQDSNFGIRRKVFSDKMQEASDQLLTIYTEKFVQTASQYLDVWEKEYGLPVNPTGLDVATRRARILGRIKQGPFTRTRRREIVEQYIEATFGTVVSFGPSGVPIGAGITLHSPAGDVSSLYSITEDISGFAYTITINPAITPDTAGLTKELTKITPAGITFTIVFA